MMFKALLGSHMYGISGSECAVVLNTAIAVMIPARLNFRLAWKACSVPRRGAAYATWGAANVVLAVAAAYHVIRYHGQPPLA